MNPRSAAGRTYVDSNVTSRTRAWCVHYRWDVPSEFLLEVDMQLLKDQIARAFAAPTYKNRYGGLQ